MDPGNGVEAVRLKIGAVEAVRRDDRAGKGACLS